MKTFRDFDEFVKLFSGEQATKNPSEEVAVAMILEEGRRNPLSDEEREHLLETIRARFRAKGHIP